MNIGQNYPPTDFPEAWFPPNVHGRKFQEKMFGDFSS